MMFENILGVVERLEYDKKFKENMVGYKNI